MITDGIEPDHSWCSKEDTRGCLTNVVKMAKLIQHDLNFAKDRAGNLFYFYNGVYRSRGEEAISEMYLKHIRIFNEEDTWNGRLIDQITRYITTDAPLILDKPTINKINLLNGVYDIYEEREEFIFTPNSPGYLTTTQLPIIYNPVATCPAWDKFLREIFPEGVNLLLEVIGLCMIPLTALQKCIVLLGQGSNGKGVFIRGLENVIGLDNICNVSLQKLSGPQERFNTSLLIGKLVNIFGDLPVQAIKEASNFKALTGEDRMMVEYKGKQGFSYTPFARLIFSCNKRVDIDGDESDGAKRRIMHIPFTRTFVSDPKVALDIQHALSQPSEVSGLFNKIRLLLPNLIENGFTITSEIASIIDNYVPVPPSTKAWLLDNLIEDENAAIPTRSMYNYYCTHAPTPGGEGFERVKLISFIRSIFPNVKCNVTTRFWRNLPVTKAYHGIRFRDSMIQAIVLEEASKLVLHETGDENNITTN